METVGVPTTAPVVKGLTLHGGHVEEVAGEQGPAVSLLFREPTDLGDLCEEEWVEGGMDFRIRTHKFIWIGHKQKKKEKQRFFFLKKIFYAFFQMHFSSLQKEQNKEQNNTHPTAFKSFKRANQTYTYAHPISSKNSLGILKHVFWHSW